jgi:hypothetical protein
LAGLAGGGREDGVAYTGLRFARWRIWRLSSTTSMGRVRSGAWCWLGVIPRPTSPNGNGFVSGEPLLRFLKLMYSDGAAPCSGVLGSRLSLYWSPGRRWRRAADEGVGAESPKGFFVISSFFRVLSAFVRVFVAFLAASVQCVSGMYSILS